MKPQALARTAVLVVALAAGLFGVRPAAASEHGHDHHCPAGFEEKRARTAEERARDRNRDGVVCVRGEGDDREIRDDVG